MSITGVPSSASMASSVSMPASTSTRDQPDDVQADRVRPRRRAQGENAFALQSHGAASGRSDSAADRSSQVRTTTWLCPSSPARPGRIRLVDLDGRRQAGFARGRSCSSGNRRGSVHGERMRPMNTTWPSPASVPGSKASSCSPSRFPNIGMLRHACVIFLSVRDIAVAHRSETHIKICLYLFGEWMLSRPHVTLDAMVDTLKAAAESSRLRILALLSRGDLTVSDLTEILNQSQPRVSRHLKLLLEAGLIGRYQEGSWAFFRLSDDDVARDFVNGLVARVRSTATRRSSATSSGWPRSSASGRSAPATISRANAASWDEIRTLHAPDSAVEAAILQARRQAAVPVDARSRHRHRPAARDLRAALPARRRHRHVARDAGGRARQSRQGRRHQCAGAAGRHLCAAGRARRLRPRDHPSGAALSRRAGSRRSARPRGCCGRPAGW